MTQSEILKGRLDYSRSWLNSVLPRLSQEMLDWAPGKEMRTISGQLVEIIEVEAKLVPALISGEELSEEEVAVIVGDPSSFLGLKNSLTVVRERTLDFLATLSEAELAEEVTLPQWYGAY